MEQEEGGIRQTSKTTEKWQIERKRRKIKKYKKKTNFGDFSIQTLWKFLKKRMNFRFRKVTLVSTKRRQNRFNVMNHLFSKKYIDHISKNKSIIYIDECSFHGNNHKLRTWHDGNTEEIVYHPGRFKSFCLVAAMDEEKMVHYQLIDNTMKANDYQKFLDDLLKKLEENNLHLGPFQKKTHVLYMDNARTHTSKKFLDYLKDKEIEVLYAIPYTPERKAIELFFADVKKGY